jgi:hypothetical protein
MKNLLILIVFLSPIDILTAQVNQIHSQMDTVFFNETINDSIWIECDTRAEFPGGENALANFVKQHLFYPPAAIKNKVDGKIILRFSVDNNGFANKVDFLKSLTPEIEIQCIKIINEMPKWKPATQLTNSKRGWYWRSVSSWYLLNLDFSLNNDNKLPGIVITP